MNINPTPTVKIVDTHEVSMARAQVYRAAKCAMEIHKMLHQVDNLEGWMQSKITLAADYLESVSSNLEYDIVSAVMEPASMASATVDMPMIQVSDTQADLVESPTVTQQDAEKAGYTITAQKQSQASSTTKPTTSGGASKDGNGNPFDKGTAHHAAFERGAQKAQKGHMHEAEMFPQLRSDMRQIGKTMKGAWEKYWHGSDEEQQEAQQHMRAAWIRYFRNQKTRAGEQITADDVKTFQSLADQMVVYNVQPPIQARMMPGRTD